MTILTFDKNGAARCILALFAQKMEHRVKCRATSVAKKWSRLLLCDLQPYKPYLPDCDMSLDNGLFKTLELPNLGWFSLWTGMRMANLQWRSCDRRGKNYLKYSNKLIQIDFKYLSPHHRWWQAWERSLFQKKSSRHLQRSSFYLIWQTCFGHLTKTETLLTLSTGSAVQWWGAFGLRRWKEFSKWKKMKITIYGWCHTPHAFLF